MSIFDSNQWVTSLFAVIVGVVYSITAGWFFTRVKSRRLEQRKRFSVALERGFANGTIESIEDLVNVYKGIYGLAGDDTSYKGDLARHLRRQLAGLAEGELAPTEKGASSVSSLKATITEFIRLIETENPFAGLPSAERTLLQDTREFIHSGSQEQALRKLDGLGGLIQVRQEALEKVESVNKWATPLAVIGLILTVIFGIISIFK